MLPVRLLIKRKLPELLVRIMLNFMLVILFVFHGVGFSEYFLATNDVKQGGVLRLVLLCVYLNELLLALSAAKVGCYVCSNYAIPYADDLVLTAPAVVLLLSKNADICETYASSYSMNFNAEKSKCMVVLPSCRRSLASLSSKCASNIGGMRRKYFHLIVILGI